MTIVLRLAVLLTLFVTTTACRGRSTPTEPSPQPSTQRIVGGTDWEEIEKFGGQSIAFEGTFDQVHGDHGVLTLDSGLRVYLPNIGLYLRGRPWFNYLKKRVVVHGVLRTEACDIVGYEGPSLQELSSFNVIN